MVAYSSMSPETQFLGSLWQVSENFRCVWSGGGFCDHEDILSVNNLTFFCEDILLPSNFLR